MLSGITAEMLKFLTAVWRVFGSPRISGDEKVVSGAKAACVLAVSNNGAHFGPETRERDRRV
jgi:hypothetical protein